jgi:hypothetical protein
MRKEAGEVEGKTELEAVWSSRGRIMRLFRDACFETPIWALRFGCQMRRRQLYHRYDYSS